MQKIIVRIVLVLAATALMSVSALAQGSYKKPPKEILDVLNAPTTPSTSISPTRDKMALLTPLRYPPISELAQPMLRIAGLRINPNTNGQHRQPYSVSVTIKNVYDGKEMSVVLPAGAKIISPQWSPNGKNIAVGNITATGVELWIVDTTTARARKINNVMLNTAFGGFGWEDDRTISAQIVSRTRGAAPAYQNLTPTEPNIQETSGRTGAVQTFQDLLKSPNDERLFEYYCTSQIARIDIGGKVTEIGAPGIYDDAEFSPDGKYILVSEITRPFSYQYPSGRFPKKVSIWNTDGKQVARIADVPLQDNLPVQGVQTGPRSIAWIPSESSTLMWAEALDGGDPRKKVSPRDKLVKLSAPFTGSATDVLKVENRYQGRAFGEKDGLMLFYDYNRDAQRRRIFMTDLRNPTSIKLVSDNNVNDRYNDIGQPVMKMMPNGTNLIRQFGDEIFLSGNGASPDGDRPFLRRMNLKTLKTDEIFRSNKGEYESFVAIVDDNGSKFMTRKESPSEPPNIYLHQRCPPDTNCLAVSDRKLTEFTDQVPILRGIKKQLVKYKRADGVDLSFTLYLPPGYKEGTRLPTVVWAYPLEFTDSSLSLIHI